MSDAVIAGIASGIIATLFSSLVAWFVLSAERTEQRMLSAFTLLTGGTQNRSAGIALIEGYRPKGTWRQAAVALLANQAIYLMEESGEQDRRVEIRNLQRILCLIHSLTFRKPEFDRQRLAVDSSLRWRQAGGRRERHERPKEKDDRPKERASTPVGLDIGPFANELIAMFNGESPCDRELAGLWPAMKPDDSKAGGQN